MAKKVIVYKRIPESELNKLQAHFNVTCFDTINDDNRAEFLTALQDAEGILGSSIDMGADVLDRAPKLKAASTISVGTDNFDLAYLAQRHIPLMHTPDVLTNTTADTIFMLLMCAARRAVELSNLVREGHWKSLIGSSLYGIDVHGKTLGIIGMGRIGCAIAKRAHCGFDMKIQYHNRSVNSEAEQQFGATRVEFETLLKTSDYICVMTPLTTETEHLIGAKEFAMMKKDAIFVNGARGRVVDEEAMIEALRNGTIRAAGLDVFAVEPLPSDSPLCQLNNAVLLPHAGSATVETRQAMVECAVDNLIAALAGDISKNCANRHLLPA